MVRRQSGGGSVGGLRALAFCGEWEWIVSRTGHCGISAAYWSHQAAPSPELCLLHPAAQMSHPLLGDFPATLEASDDTHKKMDRQILLLVVQLLPKGASSQDRSGQL